ncbi:MAG: aminotransferase class I/II-fold pyridoxal phosphate-dependent enzyme [Alicyclobacillus sp.]|nr:aminotransferase class I/II-fold pyridoxal phosphate-dependent enzyme [Alicyclobacillus sp.]
MVSDAVAGSWTSLEEMPILAALVRHVRRARYPLHVPGHKQGRVMPRALLEWLGPAAALDLTELPGLDNFHAPQECIAASQALAAKAYGSDACLYSVNGSTAALMAAIAAAAPGGSVLLPGPFHLSVWRGLVLADATPVFTAVRWDPERLTCLPPAAEDVARALEAHRGVSAVLVTSPTYQGAIADVCALAKVVHRRGVPLIVDEAHGAHLGLHPALPPHSVSAGADVVVHSVHKLLPGLTQTAWVHVTGPRVEVHQLARVLRFLHTTSPSYLLLASLDAAQAWLRSEGPRAAETALGALQVLNDLPGRRPPAGVYWDPLKHWVPTGDETISRNLAGALAAQGMFVEYADPLGVLSVFGLGLSRRIADLYAETMRTACATIGRLPVEVSGVAADAAKVLLNGLSEARLEVRPRASWQMCVEQVPLAEAVGRLCGTLVTPYPPGVAVLLPGQRLEHWHVEALEALGAAGASVHGVAQGRISVLTEGQGGGGDDALHHV